MARQGNLAIDDGARGVIPNGVAAAAAVAVAGEAAVLLAAFSSDVPDAGLLGLHFLTIAAVAAILIYRRQPNDDATLATLVFLIVAIAGPAGAVAALASLPFKGGLGRGEQVLEDWYQRLANAGRVSVAAELLDRIQSGRVLRAEAPMPENYIAILETGTLEQRQRALGLIARQFHPDYSPVLRAALRSSEPVVRVQASAVVARVREELKSRVVHLVSKGVLDRPRQAAHNVGVLQELQSCDLLDAGQQKACRETIARTLAHHLSRSQDVVAMANISDRAGRAAIETFLLESERFKDLRVARRAGRIADRHDLRIRRLKAKEAA